MKNGLKTAANKLITSIKLLEPEDFEAKSAKRTFRVALPDIALDTFWLDMRKLFEKEAPGLNLHAVPYTIACSKPLLDGLRMV